MYWLGCLKSFQGVGIGHGNKVLDRCPVAGRATPHRYKIVTFPLRATESPIMTAVWQSRVIRQARVPYSQGFASPALGEASMEYGVAYDLPLGGLAKAFVDPSDKTSGARWTSGDRETDSQGSRTGERLVPFRIFERM